MARRTSKWRAWLFAVWAAVFLVWGAVLILQGDRLGWIITVGALMMLAGLVSTGRNERRGRR